MVITLNVVEYATAVLIQPDIYFRSTLVVCYYVYERLWYRFVIIFQYIFVKLF